MAKQTSPPQKISDHTSHSAHAEIYQDAVVSCLNVQSLEAGSDKWAVCKWADVN